MRFLLLCTIVVLSTTLSSCKKDPEYGAIKSTGTISYGGITYFYGTHTLRDENGKTLYALMSRKIDLEKYIGRKVEIKGRRYKNFQDPELLEVVKIKK